MKTIALTPLIAWFLVVSPAIAAFFRVPIKVFMGFCALVGAAAVALLIAHSFGYQMTENLTESLPGHFYLHKKGEPFVKGDLIAYRWHGGATYPAGVTFIKRVIGVPGDKVERINDEFWIDNQLIGRAKPVSRAGVPLVPADGGVIKPGEYFVATESVDSLDSRYAVTGNIKEAEIIGKAYEVF
jgi:conjugal transfer pilin signal peptidase TrbI